MSEPPIELSGGLPYKSELRKLARRQLDAANWSAVDDVMQDAWLRLRTRSGSAKMIANVRAYLHRVVRNLCIAENKRAGGRRSDRSLSPAEVDSGTVRINGGNSRLPTDHNAGPSSLSFDELGRLLPERQLQAYVAVRLLGRTQAEAAALMGCSQPNVHKLVKKAEARLL